MSKCHSVGLKVATMIWLTTLMVDPAISDRPHHLEVRMAPHAWFPPGAALAVRYDHGAETRLSHNWQPIAALSNPTAQPDHGLLHYRLIIEQLEQVHASVATVTVQYRLVAYE